MSHVRCTVSRFRCHRSYFCFLFYFKLVEPGGGCVINGAYPVLFYLFNFSIYYFEIFSVLPDISDSSLKVLSGLIEGWPLARLGTEQNSILECSVKISAEQNKLYSILRDMHCMHCIVHSAKLYSTVQSIARYAL